MKIRLYVLLFTLCALFAAGCAHADQSGDQNRENLPTISVIVNGTDNFSQGSMDLLKNYLRRYFRVYDSVRDAHADPFISRIISLEGDAVDNARNLALTLGTEYYASVNVVSVTEVTLTIFETATSEIVAAATGKGREDLKQQIIQNAINEIKNLQSRLDERKETGKPYKVVLLSSEEDGGGADRAISSELRILSSDQKVQRNAIGNSTYSYLVFVKRIPTAYDLFQALANDYDRAGGMEKVLDSGSFLVIKAASSGETEFSMLLSADPDTGESPKSNLCGADGCKTGDIIRFGRYEQDNDGTNDVEPIEWQILEIKGDKAFVLSVKGLDARRFNPENSGNSYSISEIRKWLTETFVDTAFTSREKSRIEPDQNRDLVTLLTSEEVERYFPEKCGRVVHPTAYARGKGAYAVGNSTCSGAGTDAGWWWLSSKGSGNEFALIVNFNGDIGNSDVYNPGYTVRPALWIRM